MRTLRFRPALIFGAGGALALIGLMVYSQVDGRARHIYWLVGLLPAIPAILALLSVLLAYSEMDERERRIHDQAFRNAFLWSALLFFGYGLLQVFSGFPGLNLALSSGLMLCAWGIAYLKAARRF